MAVLGFVYWETAGVITRETDATIEVEAAGLSDLYRLQGLPGLVVTIRQRSAGTLGRRSLYLLGDANYRPLAGNLDAWPEEGRGPPDWITFVVATEAGGRVASQIARARTFDLEGGFHLLVGRDMTERSELQRLITTALIGALGLALVLAVAGGLVMSRNLLQRLDAINRSSRVILGGNLKQRMPVSGSGDEFDQLAQNLNAMLDQIERLMAGMREVSDNIAHDLRGPISRLRSRLEVSLIERTDAAGYRRVVQETIAEADAILATFNALLDIALAESGALRAAFEPVDLALVARDAAELFQPAAEEKGLALAVEIADGAAERLTIRGNRHLLSQALANLLDNAVKYVPAGGRIHLVVRSEQSRAMLVVADDGPGIPEEFRAKATQRFARYEASRSAPGSGLGLSLVAAVAQLHGAELSLDDNHPGLKVVVAFAVTTIP
ncbi:MAG: HAMP domain-containing protein [Proteobacteria bacterium]|nr:HAMP domain-containing protein [Pseudomonadota bacterium]